MKAPEWKLVNPKTVKFSEHNPARRTTDESVAGLADSMSRNGLIYPIVVDTSNVIIDGHRRVSAAKMLGWESIAAIVATGDRDAIYATVNSTGKKMSGNDALGVWLKNEKAVSELQSTRFSGMRECVGTPMMRRVYKAGMGLQLYNLARRIGKYCDDDTNDTIVKTLNWLLEFPVAGTVAKSMSQSTSPKTIMDAIRRMKPIRLAAEIVS